MGFVLNWCLSIRGDTGYLPSETRCSPSLARSAANFLFAKVSESRYPISPLGVGVSSKKNPENRAGIWGVYSQRPCPAGSGTRAYRDVLVAGLWGYTPHVAADRLVAVQKNPPSGRGSTRLIL